MRHATASEPDLGAVGASLARAHAAAPAAERDELTGVIEETLATLAEGGAPAARLAALARFCRAARAHFGPALAERARTGHVRGEPGTDVGYDLASLVIDVARRDDERARALVRGYRAAGGD